MFRKINLMLKKNMNARLTMCVDGKYYITVALFFCAAGFLSAIYCGDSRICFYISSQHHIEFLGAWKSHYPKHILTARRFFYNLTTEWERFCTV